MNDAEHPEDERQEREDRLSRINRASVRITESLDRESVLRGAVDGACSLTAARHGGVTVIDEAGQLQDFVTSRPHRGGAKVRNLGPGPAHNIRIVGSVWTEGYLRPPPEKISESLTSLAWVETATVTHWFGRWPEGWVSPEGVKRPCVIGTYTNNFVYQRIAPGVLEELRERNPVMPQGWRTNRHHQWFTPEYGHPKLREHALVLFTSLHAAPRTPPFVQEVQCNSCNQADTEAQTRPAPDRFTATSSRVPTSCPTNRQGSRRRLSWDDSPGESWKSCAW